MPVPYLKETPSQTAGPFLHIGTMPAVAGIPSRTDERPNLLAEDGVEGLRIRVEGVIYDGGGGLVKDALVELWQADSRGRVGRHGLFGRAATDLETGLWFFETVKPGRLDWPAGGRQAPHLTFLLFARGINIHLHTRMYFPDEGAANAECPVLRRVGPLREPTVIAQAVGPGTYRFDIRLQGENETVFLDI